MGSGELKGNAKQGLGLRERLQWYNPLGLSVTPLSSERLA